MTLMNMIQALNSALFNSFFSLREKNLGKKVDE